MLTVFSQIPTMYGNVGKQLSTTQVYGRDENGERHISKVSVLNTSETLLFRCRKPLKKAQRYCFPIKQPGEWDDRA